VLNLNETYYRTHNQTMGTADIYTVISWQNITDRTDRLTSGTADQSLHPSEYTVQAFVKATFNISYVKIT
jgi:hypothetical protein